MSAGTVVWFTGLPRSGKSTLADRTCAALERCGCKAIVLDGDAVRAALHPRPAYDPASRESFYATLAGLASLLSAQGFVVLVAATAHRRLFREQARALAPRFVEVHVVTPAEECSAREGGPGLYADAAVSRELPGAGLAYEPPASPDVVAHGGHDARAVDHLLALLAPMQ